MPNVMTHDEAEFLISQRLDGMLDADDVARLDAAIHADAILAAMWREHQSLDAALRGTRVGIGTANETEETFAQIAAALDADDRAATPTYKLPGFNWKTPLAAAAMLAIGLTIGLLLQRSGGPESQPNTVAKAPTAPQAVEVAVAPTPAQIPTIRLAGEAGDAYVSTVGSNVATIALDTPADLTPQAVASLYITDRFADSRIVIEAAGRYQPDTFE